MAEVSKATLAKFGAEVQRILQAETEDHGEHTIRQILDAAQALGVDTAHNFATDDL